MPNSKTHRRGHEERSRKGKQLLSEKASSFHGRTSAAMEAAKPIPRPRTVPELLASKGLAQGFAAADERPRLTKLLLNVTLQGSLGPVHVVMTPESAVGDLIAAAVRQYLKEGRRPILPTADPSGFDLHYSQFSLESLDREERLMTLGSRNFFLCAKRTTTTPAGTGGASPASCGKEAEKASKNGFNWLKFMDFIRAVK